MVENIMDNYIKMEKRFLTEFTKAFFMELYNEKISNEYISTYIDARIYNYGVDKYSRYFYRRIYASLVNKKKEIENSTKGVDENLLNKYLKMYQFIFYIDGVRKMQDGKEMAKIICEKRINKLELSSAKNLENRIYKIIKNYDETKETFIKSYETEDFELEIEKYTLIENSYKVKLNYNFKIPYIYSDKVIKEVFNEGIINEEKLLIEYMMLTAVCIRDINQGNFAKKYIVDLAESLFTKTKKLNYTLKVINNPAIQDKVILKISYTNFVENKEVIYSLIKSGFKFGIQIDDAFKASLLELRKLAIFDYLLVPYNNKNYDLIKKHETKLSNVIIYDI